MTGRARPVAVPSAVDLSEFISEKRPGVKCSVTRALEELDGERLEKVTAALAAPHVTHKMISQRLSEWTPVRVGAQAVMRHRADPRDCTCVG